MQLNDVVQNVFVLGSSFSPSPQGHLVKAKQASPYNLQGLARFFRQLLQAIASTLVSPVPL